MPDPVLILYANIYEHKGVLLACAGIADLNIFQVIMWYAIAEIFITE